MLAEDGRGDRNKVVHSNQINKRNCVEVHVPSSNDVSRRGTVGITVSQRSTSARHQILKKEFGT